MLRKFISILVAVAAITAIAGCSTEQGLTYGGSDAGATLKIGTRGPGDALDPDNIITKIRVIAFKQDGGVRTNKLYDDSSIALGAVIQHTIPTGTYDFVFIANEPASIQTALGNLTNRNGLDAIAIPATDIEYTKNIPQMQEIDNVEVLTENRVKYIDPVDGLITTNEWNLKLVRLASRVDVTLYATADLSSTFTGVKLTGIPDKVSLMPTGYTGTITRNVERTYTTTLDSECFSDITPAELPAEAAGAVWAKKVVRLIVPANDFSPANNANNAITMTVLLNGQYNPSATMGIDDQKTDASTRDYRLPRNHHLTILGEVTTPLLLNITAEPWTTVDTDGDPTKNRVLNVSEIEAPRELNNYQGEWKVSFWSNQPNVELEPTGLQWFDSSAESTATQFTVANSWDITDFEYNYNSATGVGAGTVTFKLKDILNAPNALVHHKVILRAGNDAVTGGEDLRRELRLSMRYLIYAPPGVVGISKSGKLTLKGSSTYAGTIVENIADADFNGLENEPVYMTYYRWGSTIASIGGTGNVFDSGDIVWAPGGYKGTAATAHPYDLSQAALSRVRAEVEAGTTPQEQWNLVPYGDLNGTAGGMVQVWPANNAATGLGDICAYADADSDITSFNWHIPSGLPWRNPWRNGEEQYPFGVANIEGVNPYYAAATGIQTGIAGARAAMSGNIFLAEAGLRNDLGNMLHHADSGEYGTSTIVQNNQNSTHGLSFRSSALYISFSHSNVSGRTIRCVKDNGLVHAAPGMIGIRDQAPAAQITNPNAVHELTLAGSNIYAARSEPFVTSSEFGPLNQEPVYAVYYKWGSTIAIIGEQAGINGETGAYDAHDVVNIPVGFTGTITDTYTSFTNATPTGTIGSGVNISTNAGQGWGDPCAAFGDWRMPTNPWTLGGFADNAASNPYWRKDIPISMDNEGDTEGGSLSTDNTVFLPGAGVRNDSGAVSWRKDGVYWTSTSTTGSGPGTQAGYRFSGVAGLVRLNTGSPYGYAMPIRCVENTAIPPVPPTGDINPPASPLRFTYVGAFWRADQTGERVISIPVDANNTGYWTAQIYSYGIARSASNFATDDGVTTEFKKGDILLSTALSADPAMHGSANPALWTTATNPANPYVDEQWKVSAAGASQSVSGFAQNVGDRIYFRIGLKNAWDDQAGYNAATNPARYAVILLSYHGTFEGSGYKHQLIYLRQGHEADRLFENGGTRTYSVPVIPYNLRDPNWNNISNVNSMVNASTGLLPTRGGTWTDYPSQAGHHFHFDLNRRAFSTGVTFTTWDNNATPSTPTPGVWEPTVDETCPVGYRRPSGTYPELAHSMFKDLTGATSNSVTGYYADGFFDRRPGWDSLSVVATTSQRAFIGELFYSDMSFASIFFPMAGNRDSYGVYDNIDASEISGRYWTDRPYYYWANFLPTLTFPSNHATGLSIRCVVDE